MIEADVDQAFAALARRLTAKAARLAEARARERVLVRRGDERRWRRAGIVWPLFGRG